MMPVLILNLRAAIILQKPPAEDRRVLRLAWRTRLRGFGRLCFREGFARHC